MNKTIKMVRASSVYKEDICRTHLNMVPGTTAFRVKYRQRRHFTSFQKFMGDQQLVINHQSRCGAVLARSWRDSRGEQCSAAIYSRENETILYPEV